MVRVRGDLVDPKRPNDVQLLTVLFPDRASALAMSLCDILLHVGESTTPPRIAPARDPPLRDPLEAETGDAAPHAQPAPEVEFDQRLAW